MKAIPVLIEKELVDGLKRTFPVLKVTPETTVPEVYYEAGIRRVIAFLETVQALQTNQISGPN